jgi:hypothetical protein
VACAEKSGENAAIRKRPRPVDVKGAIITIDATGRREQSPAQRQGWNGSCPGIGGTLEVFTSGDHRRH